MMQTMEHLQMYDAAGCELFLQTLRLMRLEMKKRYKQVVFFLIPCSSIMMMSHQTNKQTIYFLFITYTQQQQLTMYCTSWIPPYWTIWVK